MGSIMQKKLFASIFSTPIATMMILVTIVTPTVLMVSAQEATNTTGTSAEPHEEGGEHAANATTVRDSTAVLLSGETIPGGSFIHLYDSTPDVIVSGHVAAKIPCNEDSNSTLTILTGAAPNLQPTELELLQNLSSPGELCLYHADLASEPGGNVTTDIAIQNPGEDEIELPATSTVVIGVNKIMPGVEEHGHDVAEEGAQPAATGGNSTQ
jgi:hypothetical protein